MILSKGLLPDFIVKKRLTKKLADEMGELSNNCIRLETSIYTSKIIDVLPAVLIERNYKNKHLVPKRIYAAHTRLLGEMFTKKNKGDFILRDDYTALVCEEWLDLLKFNEDLSKLKLYCNLVNTESNEYTLTNVVYNSKWYSPETACIIDGKLLPAYKANIMYKVVKDDETTFILRPSDLSTFTKIAQSTINKWNTIKEEGETHTFNAYEITRYSGLFRYDGDEILTPSQID